MNLSTTRSIASMLRELKFTYRRSLNDLGSALLKEGSPLRELETEQVFSGRALVVLRDDRWHVQMMRLYG